MFFMQISSCTSKAACTQILKYLLHKILLQSEPAALFFRQKPRISGKSIIFCGHSLKGSAYEH